MQSVCSGLDESTGSSWLCWGWVNFWWPLLFFRWSLNRQKWYESLTVKASSTSSSTSLWAGSSVTKWEAKQGTPRRFLPSFSMKTNTVGWGKHTHTRHIVLIVNLSSSLVVKWYKMLLYIFNWHLSCYDIATEKRCFVQCSIRVKCDRQ